MRHQLSRLLVAGETGFTTIVVLSVLMVGTLFVGAAFTIAQGDSGPSRRDQYAKQAYAAAEAGVNFYLAHLLQNGDYWKNCYTAPSGATVYPVYSPGTVFDTSHSTAIPGSQARYQIELLNARGQSACSSSPASVIDATTGGLSVRSTGSYRNIRRSLVATFTRPGFLNFLWFTDKETPDPAASGTSVSSCNKYYRDGRSGCGDQVFVTGDALNGPVHTNDIFYISSCDSPSFGRPGKDDAIEASDPNGCRPSATCTSNVIWNGPRTWGANVLTMPPPNTQLKNYASANGAGGACSPSTTAACWVFTGPVHITFLSTGIKVEGPTTGTNSSGAPIRTLLKTGNTAPPNGVIYVQAGTCTATFSDTQWDSQSSDVATPPVGSTYSGSPGYPANDGCGDAWVRGAAASDVTVEAQNDVIVDGDVTHGSAVAVGLIADGFVRVYHPCVWTKTTTKSGNKTNTTSSQQDWNTSPEDPGTGYMDSPNINAAILSLNHSFLVDNYACGSQSNLDNLNVTGALAQNYRGTVGQGGVGGSGYIKNYTYDPSLKYHQPPYFLQPTNATWQLSSQTEQVPAH